MQSNKSRFLSKPQPLQVETATLSPKGFRAPGYWIDLEKNFSCTPVTVVSSAAVYGQLTEKKRWKGDAPEDDGERPQVLL